MYSQDATPLRRRDQLGPLRDSPTPPRLTKMGLSALSSPSSGVTSPPLNSLPTTADTLLLRGLRRDVVSLQHMLDSLHNRGPLSAPARSLDDELIGLQTLPVEQQALKLLRIVQRLSTALGSMFSGEDLKKQYAPLDPVVGPLLLACQNLVELQEDLAADETLNESIERHEVHPRVKAAREKSLAAIALRQQLLEEALEADLREQNCVGDHGDTQGLSRSTSPRLGGTSRLAASTNQPAVSLATGAVMPMKPISAGSIGLLESLGIPLPLAPPGEELDLNSLLHRVVTAARKVKNSNGAFEERMKMTQEFAAQKERQHQREVEALTTRLAAQESELDRLRSTSNASRFDGGVSGASRHLVTSHDAPMSFDVERQYQRTIRQLQLHTAEVESSLAQSLKQASQDRAACGGLEATVQALREEIRMKDLQFEALKADRDEQKSLFDGVSRTRDIEAKMCSSAVSQLEEKTKEQRREIQDRDRCIELLQRNLRTLVDDWCDAQRELVLHTKQLQQVSTELQQHHAVFNRSTYDRLEETQKMLLAAYDTADIKEAECSILKQKLLDTNHIVEQLLQESKTLPERLRQCTEWKLLSVKAPEESKQFLVRWGALQADRERRESALLSSFAARVSTFQERADAELVERRAAHRTEVQPVRAQDVVEEYHRTLQFFGVWNPQVREVEGDEVENGEFADEPDREKEGESGEVVVPEASKDAFVVEAGKREVSFLDVYQDLFPEDEDEVIDNAINDWK